MTKHEKVANIIAFFSIMFEDNPLIWKIVMDYHPDYIIEKFERYINSVKVEYPWGLHPVLKDNCFDRYMDKWDLELSEP